MGSGCGIICQWLNLAVTVKRGRATHGSGTSPIITSGKKRQPIRTRHQRGGAGSEFSLAMMLVHDSPMMGERRLHCGRRWSVLGV